MTRRYGKVPSVVKDDLDRWVAVLKEAGVARPYDVIGDLLHVTHHRVQQIVLEQRKAQERKREQMRFSLDDMNDVFDEEDD